MSDEEVTDLKTAVETLKDGKLDKRDVKAIGFVVLLVLNTVVEILELTGVL